MADTAKYTTAPKGDGVDGYSAEHEVIENEPVVKDSQGALLKGDVSDRNTSGPAVNIERIDKTPQQVIQEANLPNKTKRDPRSDVVPGEYLDPYENESKDAYERDTNKSKKSKQKSKGLGLRD